MNAFYEDYVLLQTASHSHSYCIIMNMYSIRISLLMCVMRSTDCCHCANCCHRYHAALTFLFFYNGI